MAYNPTLLRSGALVSLPAGFDIRDYRRPHYHGKSSGGASTSSGNIYNRMAKGVSSNARHGRLTSYTDAALPTSWGSDYLAFSGTSERIVFPSTILSDNVTVKCEFYPNSVTNVSLFGRGTQDNRFIRITSATTIRVDYAIARDFTVGSISTGAWHTLEVRYTKSGNIEVYVDGVPSSSNPQTTGGTSWSCDTIGRRTNAAPQNFNGRIRNVQVWSTADGGTGSPDVLDMPLSDGHTPSNDFGATRACVAFDGVDGAIRVPDVSALDLLTNWTVSGFVFLNSIAAAQVLTNKGANGHAIRFNTSGNLELNVSGGSNISTSSVALAINEWHHVAVTWDGTTCKMYLDGVDCTGATTLDSFLTTAFDLGIGYRPDTSANYFNGKMRLLKVHNSVLTPTQVATLYRKDLATRPLSIADWRLFEANPDVVIPDAVPEKGIWTEGSEYLVTDAGEFLIYTE